VQSTLSGFICAAWSNFTHPGLAADLAITSARGGAKLAATRPGAGSVASDALTAGVRNLTPL
jgi:hypothetical protein